MFKIKSSYGKCEICSLENANSCILETNTNGKLEDTQILFITENPGKDEVEQEIPLIGKAGKIFRHAFDNIIKDNFHWCISNCVLCATIKSDGNTGNPTWEEVENCKENIFKLVEFCDPDIIVLMGSVPMRLFGIAKDGITKRRGKFYEWNDRKLFLCVHPSYIGHNGGTSSSTYTDFEADFKAVADHIKEPSNGDITFDLEELVLGSEELNTSSDDVISSLPEVKEVSEDGLDNNKNLSHMFQIDKKYYTNAYRLVDVQYITNANRLFYIFRDKNNKKVFYEPPAVQSNYYYYQSVTQGRLIEKISDLELVQCSYKDRINNLKCYGSDVPIDVKHATDYYLQNEGEAPKDHVNIFFFDIEVYCFDDKAFPTAESAKRPISSISFTVDGAPIETYLLNIKDRIDPKVVEFIENSDYPITLFDREEQLIRQFIKRIQELAPDILTAWNISFDLGYMYTRMKRLGMNPDTLSPFDNCYIDVKSNYCLISGFVVLDMMTIYKNLRENLEESYSLQAVSEKVLGKGKLEYEGRLEGIYEKDIKHFVEYNRTDVQRLIELNDNLQHISLMNELRTMATTSWKGASSTIGQADGLFQTNLKKRGMCARNGKVNQRKDEIPGAYIKEPKGGVYEWLVDFDFTALYPNIVRSWNIGPNTYIGKVERDIAFRIIYENLLGKVMDEGAEDEEIKFTSDPLHANKTSMIKVSKLFEIIREYKAVVNTAGTIFMGHDIEQSVFYEIYNYLLETRKEYKKLKFSAKGKVEKKMYDNRQWALKILANSLYGVLLNEHFRFYSTDLGISVTLCGQELTKFAGLHLNQYMETGKTDVDLDFNNKFEGDVKYIVYADTDSLFVKMGDYILDKKKVDKITVENIFEEVSKIEPILNSKLIDIFAKCHRIPPEHSFLELKQEIIADRAYFLNVKKRYALHIVNREHHDVDETEVKGIETRRSDYSVLTKEMLKTILNMILKSEGDVDVSEILDYVEVRKVMVQEAALEGNKGIGRPVTFGKKLKEYKTIPRQVKGMLAWNSIVYEYFDTGIKGIEFPILGIDLEKAPDFVKENYNNKYLKDRSAKDLHAIVVPEEEPILPVYFKPDIKKLVSFAVEERVKLLLQPLVRETSDMLKF